MNDRSASFNGQSSPFNKAHPEYRSPSPAKTIEIPKKESMRHLLSIEQCDIESKGSSTNVARGVTFGGEALNDMVSAGQVLSRSNSKQSAGLIKQGSSNQVNIQSGLSKGSQYWEK